MMKVGDQSFSSTTASNSPNCNSASFQCAGASWPSDLRRARSAAASPACASVSSAWRTSESRTVRRVKGGSRSTTFPA